MKIVKFEAENIKKLRVVEITPTGNIVQLTGPNGAGKSSILDSIWYALGGTQNIPDVPLRKGAKKGHVTLDLGELVVTRKFSEGGSTELRVESKDGERLKSPQQILDKLTGSLTFDPLAFSRMKPAAMLEELRKLVKLDVDIDALDRQNVADYAQRTDLNREAKSLHAQSDGIFFPDTTPDEEIDVSSLVSELQEAGKINAEVEKSKADKQALEHSISEAERISKQLIESSRQTMEQATTSAKAKRERGRQLTASAEEEAKRLTARAAAEAARLDNEADNLVAEENLKASKMVDQSAVVSGKANDYRQQLESWKLPESVDTAEISRKIQAANTANRFVSLKKQKDAFSKKATDTERKALEITRTMERREEEKANAIAAAKMPIEGLSFGNGQVLFKGIPFEQASSAEQLRVSTAIAIAMNPKLRVIRIQDGSLLDQGNMEALAEMADKNDMQIWIERVTGIGNAAVVIDSGEIVS